MKQEHYSFTGTGVDYMEQNMLSNKLVAWSAIGTALAGAIHLWIVPDHWKHAPAHGLFFLLVGIAQVIWSVFVWRQPSIRLYYIGVLMAGWLIALYGITRWLPAPFGHGPEEISLIDVVCKLCEGLGMITLGILIFQGLILKAGRAATWRTMALIVFFSFSAGFVTYGVARAAEPIFPVLSAPTDEHQHIESPPGPGEEHHHDEESAPTQKHDHTP